MSAIDKFIETQAKLNEANLALLKELNDRIAALEKATATLPPQPQPRTEKGGSDVQAR